MTHSTQPVPYLPEAEVLTQIQNPKYPKQGPEGISYFRGQPKDYLRQHVDCLIYREGGQIVATLNHFPVAMGPERAGDVLVLVLPAYRRQGIATALWEEAQRRWGATGDVQRVSPVGERFLAAVEQTPIPDAFRATPRRT